MTDMIKKFKDHMIMKEPVSVDMVNSFGNEEHAVDTNGVFLDALSAFWSSFFDSCSVGEEESPVIRHDFQSTEWESLSVTRKADFPNIHQVEKLFEEAKPTNKKVLGLISANCINSAEREAVSYFQHYIRGVDREKLTKFLRFCTGSTMSCVQKITLMFTHLDGFQRRLVGHTCGAVFRVACHLPIFSPVVRK